MKNVIIPALTAALLATAGVASAASNPNIPQRDIELSEVGGVGTTGESRLVATPDLFESEGANMVAEDETKVYSFMSYMMSLLFPNTFAGER